MAAGDASFIKRAGKITEKILSRSNIIVFASHSTHLLKKFRSRGMVLVQGRPVYFGSVEKALQAYLGGIS